MTEQPDHHLNPYAATWGHVQQLTGFALSRAEQVRMAAVVLAHSKDWDDARLLLAMLVRPPR